MAICIKFYKLFAFGFYLKINAFIVKNMVSGVPLKWIWYLFYSSIKINTFIVVWFWGSPKMNSLTVCKSFGFLILHNIMPFICNYLVLGFPWKWISCYAFGFYLK